MVAAVMSSDVLGASSGSVLYAAPTPSLPLSSHGCLLAWPSLFSSSIRSKGPLYFSMTLSSLILSSKTISSNKVTFQGNGAWDFNMLFW